MRQQVSATGSPIPGRSMRFTLALIGLLFGGWGAGVQYSNACNIPVFRYALERWPADDYEIIVFHQDDLKDAAEFQKLRDAIGADSGGLNAKMIPVDVDAIESSSYADVWKTVAADEGRVQLPHVVLRMRLPKGRWVNAWRGPLDDSSVEQITDSPVRKELRQRLLAGHAIVWLMLDCDDQAKNAKVRERLESQFAKLPEKIELPEGIGLPGSELYADVPLILKFSLLSIDPDDPREELLTTLLNGLVRNSANRDEPLLVPVFGRGRGLEVIPASSLPDRLVADLTRFLSAACSCQVKDQNPGFDLLIRADWERELFGSEGDRRPDRSAVEGQNRSPVLLTIPPGRDR